MMRTHQTFCAIASILWLTGAAGAEPKVTLRISTNAPEGSFWARELRGMANEIDGAMHGAVSVKMYYGGIAGDERQVQQRIGRGQLDGLASGGDICMDVSPAIRAPRHPNP